MDKGEHEIVETTGLRSAVRAVVAEALRPYVEDMDRHVREWPQHWQDAYDSAPDMTTGNERVMTLRSIDAASAAMAAMEKVILSRIEKEEV